MAYGPLAGVKVIELSHIMAGPMCGLLLADLGADVIKVEKYPDGDDSRRMVPPTIDGESAAFMILNRNKRGISLNLKSPGGKAVLEKMLSQADVVIENYRPGTMERFDLGYDTLHKMNPALIYCQVTGYQGTTQKAERASDVVLDRVVKVRFDANTAAELPWTFEPMQSSLEVKVGENTLAFYKATNHSDKPTTGTAVFNVTPDAVGSHFNKVQCFCFTEQRLEPGQSIEMAVSFFVDPAFATDEETKNLSELTLSYAFYPVTAPKKEGQAATASSSKGG